MSCIRGKGQAERSANRCCFDVDASESLDVPRPSHGCPSEGGPRRKQPVRSEGGAPPTIAEHDLPFDFPILLFPVAVGYRGYGKKTVGSHRDMGFEGWVSARKLRRPVKRASPS
jgi:hypothetical protein